MPHDIASEFERATLRWRDELKADEWFFARLTERLVDRLSPAEAFDAIGDLVDLVMRERDSDLRTEAAQVLIALARRSDTTQVHPRFDQNWKALAAKLPRFQIDELTKWYRKPSD